MFKGIKKRFNSSRSGRGRKSERSPPPGSDAPQDTTDRKSTSPRQVHPADLGVCGAPYARRSLERGGGGGGGRHPKSPPISPTQSTTTTTTPHIAYPTTPNLCVTAGKIEFITPPDSTLSSTASRCSTLKLSPTNHSGGEDVCPRTSPAYSPSYHTAHIPSHNRSRHENGTPPSTPSRGSGSSSFSSKDNTEKTYAAEIQNDKFVIGPQGSLKPIEDVQHINLNESFGYSHNRMDTNKQLQDHHKVDELRRENEEVKLRLSSLQNEFAQLENQVHVLMAERQEVETKLRSEQEKQEIAYANKLLQYQATIAALDQCATPLVEDPPVQQVLAEESQSKENLINRSNDFIQTILERCRTLEQANVRLQSEARKQQEQYEICLDRVATQVVQALLSQKSHQEYCIKLAHQVQDLRRQNAALSSLVGHSGTHHTLPCPHRHRCPLPSYTPSFLSLPASLTKNRQQGDIWPAGGWVASWHMEESSQRSSLQLLNDGHQRRDDTGSSQDGSSSVTTQTTTCWYDIVTSLGGGCPSATVTSKQNNPGVDYEWSSQTNCKKIADSNGASCVSPACVSDSPNSKFSPLSLESASTSASNSPEQKNCHFQTKLDNLAFEKSKILNKKEMLNDSANDKNTNVIMNNLSKDQISDILKVKSEILRSLAPSANINSSVFSCDDKSKGVLNKNLAKVNINKNGVNESGEETGEGTVRDEGYSTMSSDVQAEVKDSITTSSVTTVQEEPLIVSLASECVNQEVSSVSVSLSEKDSTMNENDSVEQPSFNGDTESLTRKDSENERVVSLDTEVASECVFREGFEDSDGSDQSTSRERKVSLVVTNTEYCDGLRVIYDEEDNNSDVFFIPIQEPENESLYRHSYHVPSTAELKRLVHWYSDSQLYTATSQPSKFVRSLDRHVSVKDLTERTASTEEVLEEACNTRSMKRSAAQASLKRRSKAHAKEECTTSGSSEEIWPLRDHHRKYLSPSYSHAELEDWSLDLSSEYLSGPCGEGEGSESVCTTGAHQGSLPSIQEATPDLEEDNNEFLWNGATYFKADIDLNWSSKKELTKSWQLDHSKENQTVMSPRSGCSDQPAVWSSSEHLSCCSEGVSKCSSDFENFCEQICNLPELKRVSFCSSEPGGQASKAATPETSSIEGHEEELVDELNVDTVFTRDFYRLVKFESSKSLAASSKSLATTDGMLTIEKLQDLENGGNHKEALASVLGFIAEQRQYCKEREAQDEKDTSQAKEVLRLSNAFDNTASSLTASMIFRGTFPKTSLRESCSEKGKFYESFAMKTLPPLLLKQNSIDSALTKLGPAISTKPSSSYLKSDLIVDDSCNNLVSNRHSSAVSHPSTSYFPSASLPVSPTTALPEPSVPSRSTSLAYPQVYPACGVESLLPHVPMVPIRSVSHIPGTNPTLEKQQDASTHLPPVPEHHYSAVCSLPPDTGPPLPCRSSSMAFPCNVLPVPEHKVSLTESPPVPKRITSRALPKLPSATHHSGSHDPKRPRSFIKETAPKRFSLQELQHMARVEEEEKRVQLGTCTAGTVSASEAVSPGDAAGLGTSWVRVQPHIDLQDPQARASLLDGMIESSEGCSSETEEDEGVAHQYSQLRSMHRSRRKRKVSHRSGGGRIVMGAAAAARPTVIGRGDLFQRYGDQEKAALQEFEFLCDFSTSHSDLGSQDLLGACGGLSEKAFSGTPVHSHLGRDVGAVSHKLEKNLSDKDEKFKCRTSRLANTNEVKSRTFKSYLSNSSCIEQCDNSDNGIDTRSICSVKAAIHQLNKNNHISGTKQPATPPIPANRSASSTSNVRINSSSSTNKLKQWNSVRSKPANESITSNPRSKINTRQGNSPSSRTPSPQLRVKDNIKCNSSGANNIYGNTVDKLQGLGVKITDRTQASNSTNSGSPTRIPRIQTPLTSSKKARADSQKSQKGEDSYKDSSVESPKRLKPQCERALPPKGFSFRAVKPSPRIRTNTSLQQRHMQRVQQQQQNQQLSVGRNARVTRLRKTDPLDSFMGKSLFDSGSSEGSELCGGRLSLSDSCAENFSPIDSGEEVFEKEC